jgi:hypothetical protein
MRRSALTAHATEKRISAASDLIKAASLIVLVSQGAHVLAEVSCADIERNVVLDDSSSQGQSGRRSLNLIE